MNSKPTAELVKRSILPLGLIAALALTGCSTSSGDTTTDAPPGAAASGFKVKTEDCIDPDAATKKISGPIKIGYSLALSGPVAGVVGFFTSGFNARIAAENAQGGVDGHKIEVEYKDDAYQPDKAKANATYFLQSAHVDLINTFSTGAVGAIADDQNAACVPMLYASASAQNYRDINQYPWTIQYLPSSDAEARYDISLIKSKFPGRPRIGVAETQTASGIAASKAFQTAAKNAGLEIAVVAPSTDPNAAATALKAAGVEVVFDAGVTPNCAVLDIAMARIGYKPKLVVNSSNCADQTEYETAGQASDGDVIPMYLKDPGAPENANDPGVKTYVAQMAGDKNTNNILAVAGWVQADLTINTLKQAAASPQGLTHVSIIETARDQTYRCPMVRNGIDWISKPTELIGFNALQTMVWSAAEKRFKPEGEIIKITN